MNLYNYQQKIINDLRQVQKLSPVLVLPCGGGKSVICAEIARLATLKKNRVLFLVHRIELVEQITETFTKHNVDMSLCDVAMVQSAHKLKDINYRLIITDESHHATCNTYKRIYEQHPNAYRINVTATPCRSDGRGLGETCGYLLNSVTSKWLIQNHYLAPYEYYSVTVANLEAIKKVRGEYEDITDLLNKPKIYGDVMKYYKPNSKVICYCSSIAHSIATAEQFNLRGIPAEHIDGNTNKAERHRIITDFRNGKIKVLCNFSLLGEGFDVPDCDTVFILRKTASLNLFIQMSMRCMRYKANKMAYIYDFCGNCYEHGLPDDDREWTLDSKVKMQRNPSGEKDILVRQCSKCYKVYAGTSRICPYCGNDNGKTKKEIEQEKQAELTRIEKIEKQELKDAGQSLQDLIIYGKKKGYKPSWAFMRWQILQKYRKKYGKNT